MLLLYLHQALDWVVYIWVGLVVGALWLADSRTNAGSVGLYRKKKKAWATAPLNTSHSPFETAVAMAPSRRASGAGRCVVRPGCLRPRGGCSAACILTSASPGTHLKAVERAGNSAPGPSALRRWVGTQGRHVFMSGVSLSV